MANKVNHLPEEVWLIIIERIDAISRRNLCLVNKFLYDVVKGYLSRKYQWILFRAPQKINQTMWKALQSRHSVNVLLENGNDAKLAVILMHLSNITALKVQFDSLTLITFTMILSCRATLTTLDIEFNRMVIPKEALVHLKLLTPRLVNFRLSCIINIPSVFDIFAGGFPELTALSLDLKFVDDEDNCSFPTNHRYCCKKKCSPCAEKSSYLWLDKVKTLQTLEHLTLEKALFWDKIIFFKRLKSLTSLTLANCSFMSEINVLEKNNHLKELTLKNTALYSDSEDLFLHLPSSLVSLTLCTIIIQKESLCLYLKQNRKNLHYLEFNRVLFFPKRIQEILEALPGISVDISFKRSSTSCWKTKASIVQSLHGYKKGTSSLPKKWNIGATELSAVSVLLDLHGKSKNGLVVERERDLLLHDWL